MEDFKVLGEGTNFTAISTGKFDDLKNYVLPLSESVFINGKVFTGEELKATGMEMSLQTMWPGQESPFLHAHKKHEELYMIIKGEGEFRVDDKVFPVAEGSLVRVAPAGKRALRNTGKEHMVVMCIQYMAGSFGADDTPAGDGVLLDEDAFPDSQSR